jgi:hypothetical protein
MKKHILWLPVVIVVVLLAAWTKPMIENLNFEKPVNKNISFAVYKNTTYASNVYNDASAKLQVSIVKVRGNKRETVWQKSYDAKLLKEYPTLANAMMQQVVIKNVVDSKEHLEVEYTVTYGSKNGTMQLQDGATISKGAQVGNLFINI